MWYKAKSRVVSAVNRSKRVFPFPAVALLLLLAALLVSCQGGGERRPPEFGGFELADSPWPKVNADLRNTRHVEGTPITDPEIAWVREIEGRVAFEPVIAGDKLIVVTWDPDRIIALNLNDGSAEWMREAEVISNPIITNRGIVLVVRDTYVNIVLLDDHGNMIDSVVLANRLISRKVLSNMVNGFIFVVGDGNLYRLDIIGGNIYYSSDVYTGQPIDSVAYNDVLIVLNSDKDIVAIDTNSLRILSSDYNGFNGFFGINACGQILLNFSDGRIKLAKAELIKADNMLKFIILENIGETVYSGLYISSQCSFIYTHNNSLFVNSLASNIMISNNSNEDLILNGQDFRGLLAISSNVYLFSSDLDRQIFLESYSLSDLRRIFRLFTGFNLPEVSNLYLISSKDRLIYVTSFNNGLSKVTTLKNSD